MIQPFMVSRRQLTELFGSPRLVQRMMAAGWFEVVLAGKPGRATLYSYASAQRALDRLKTGEEPPPLTCETKGGHHP